MRTETECRMKDTNNGTEDRASEPVVDVSKLCNCHEYRDLLNPDHMSDSPLRHQVERTTLQLMSTNLLD